MATPISQTTARVLEQTQVNVPFRVQTHPNRAHTDRAQLSQAQVSQGQLSQAQPGQAQLSQAQPSSATARPGATQKPLANGAPSGPGSDQSHDRKGVIFRNQAQPHPVHPNSEVARAR